MAGVPKPHAIEAFFDSMNDAESLVNYDRALRNSRTYRMRAELRERIGSALRIAKGARSGLDVVESSDLFVVLKPDSTLSREDFSAPRLMPLLRQVYVVVAAAMETYVADRTMELLKGRMNQAGAPAELCDLPVTVGVMLDNEVHYQRRAWGIRAAVEDVVRQAASPAPTQVAKILKLAGVKDLWGEVDRIRKVEHGTSRAQLQHIVDRRNRIAHASDRVGRSRARVSVEEARDAIRHARGIALAIERTSSVQLGLAEQVLARIAKKEAKAAAGGS